MTMNTWGMILLKANTLTTRMILSYFRSTVLILIAVALLGCVKNNKTGSLITDPEHYYNLSGFSVKPPAGSNWVMRPKRDNFLNSIDFVVMETTPAKTEPNHLDGTVTFVTASSSMLDEPVPSRTDTVVFTDALKTHLKRYHSFNGFKITQSAFDRSFGYDCLRFQGKPSRERELGDWGDIRMSEAQGFFCLHPDRDNFGVIMVSRDGVSVGINPVNRNQQVDHLFRSLHFAQISTAVSRTFISSTHTVGKSPYQLIINRGMIWVALRDENRVVKIDPTDGKVVASAEVGSLPVSITGGEKGVWVANSGDATVTRIDPETNLVEATIRVGGKLSSISAGRGGVWVTDAVGNRVVKIDPTNNTIAATISVGREPVSVNAGNDGIWCTNASDGTLTIIDPTSDQAVSSIDIGGRPIRVAIADTGAWVADEAGNRIVRIDRKTKKVSARITLDNKPSWVTAIDSGEVFVALSNAAKVIRIDPDENRILGSAIKVKGTPRSMVLSNGKLWVANSGGTAVIGINLNPYGQLLRNYTSE